MPLVLWDGKGPKRCPWSLCIVLGCVGSMKPQKKAHFARFSDDPGKADADLYGHRSQRQKEHECFGQDLGGPERLVDLPKVTQLVR